MRGVKPTDQNIPLGLAISGALLKPGETRTLYEIASFCNCSGWAIHLIERKALRKVRRRLEQQGITIEQVREVLKVWNKL